MSLAIPTCPDRPSCPLCGADTFRPYRLGLVKCVACGIVISPDLWSPQANDSFEQIWFGEDFQETASGWVRLFETWSHRKTLARLALARPPGHRLLEVGVGSGSFLSAAHERGYDVMGCDLSAPICDHVQRTYGFQMHSGPLETLHGDGRFD